MEHCVVHPVIEAYFQLTQVRKEVDVDFFSLLLQKVLEFLASGKIMRNAIAGCSSVVYLRPQMIEQRVLWLLGDG